MSIKKITIKLKITKKKNNLLNLSDSKDHRCILVLYMRNLQPLYISNTYNSITVTAITYYDSFIQSPSLFTKPISISFK